MGLRLSLCVASGISIISLFMSEIALAYFRGSTAGMRSFLSNVGYFHSRSMGVLRLPGDQGQKSLTAR
jgi:hypothetical protein